MRLSPITDLNREAPKTAAAALYEDDSTVESPEGSPYTTEYKDTPFPVKTPEGFDIVFFENGANDILYIELSEGHWAKFTKESSAPGHVSSKALSRSSLVVDRGRRSLVPAGKAPCHCEAVRARTAGLAWAPYSVGRVIWFSGPRGRPRRI